jgi:cysteinyl-tRNA synthetase
MPASTITLYNTMTRRLEPFEPLVPGTARVYVCGPTTYNVAHAGHARAYVAFDILVRHLRARGFAVTYVRNVTDVDDKILQAAKSNGEEPLALSARMAKLVDDDWAAIGLLPPDHEPRVSGHIDEIILFIESLIAKGHAYTVDTPKGYDVYFAVRSFPAYGKLSHRNIDDLQSGARVEVGGGKRDPLDFALWKGDEDGWGWPSPWGNGRPGWHIECSAMAAKYLGNHFDMHGGGEDLIFPHHENEIAQSEAAHGAPFAKCWLHNGFVTVDREKMSKSLGNFVTVQDVLARNDPEGFRYFLLGTHYRGPLAFEVDTLEDGRVVFPLVDQAERRVEYLYTTLESLEAVDDGEAVRGEAGGEVAALSEHGKVIAEAPDRVSAALDKDLNTPQALAVLADLAKAANEVALFATRAKKDKAAQAAGRRLARAAKAALTKACEPLGLMQASPLDFFDRTRAQRLRVRGLAASLIEERLAERAAARERKDFARADALRGELLTMGVLVLDSASGSTWKVTI